MTDTTHPDLMDGAHERFVNAMGTVCHLVVAGQPDLLDQATHRIHDLERRWSRFLPDSEISRLNRADGDEVAVSPETFLLVSRSVEAWQLTGGMYDPTVLPSVVGCGYDRSFTDPAASAHDPDRPPSPPTAAPGAGNIALDTSLRTVRLPPTVQVDPGGIGKGLAADIVAEELSAAGARGACVNLGGDLRTIGRSPTGSHWPLGLGDPMRPDHVIPLEITGGAVATSTTRTRQWTKHGRRYHHLIDPRTGLPSTSDIHTATVVADRCWWAEVLAKTLLLADMPGAHDIVTRTQTSALLAGETGGVHELGRWTAYVGGQR